MDYLQRLKTVLENYPQRQFSRIIDLFQTVRGGKGTVYLIGNGGSASTCSHFAADLVKGCGFKAFALPDMQPTLSAYENDISHERAFACMLYQLATPQDLVIGISASGSSPNVLNGLRSAHEQNAKTIGLAGYDGGKMRQQSLSSLLVVPSTDMQVIEDVHLMTCHMVMQHFREVL